MKKKLWLAMALALILAWPLGSALAVETFVSPSGVIQYNAAKSAGGYTLFSGTGAGNTTTYLIDYLSAKGYHDLAYRRVMQPVGRSYGAMLESGSTAMREAFDGAGGGLNHLGMNSVFGWLMAYVAGIRPDPDGPGYKHFFIAPKMGGGVTWVRSSYDSVRGKIVSDWNIDNGLFSLRVVVPPNTTATITLPARIASEVTESGKPIAQATGVTLIGTTDGCAVYTVEAGDYRFNSQV